MTLLAVLARALYVTTAEHLGAGGPPVGVKGVQLGAPPVPLAFFNTQTSFGTSIIPSSHPPKIVIVLAIGSYTAECSARPAGRGSGGFRGLRAAPPTPLAFSSPQAS